MMVTKDSIYFSCKGTHRAINHFYSIYHILRVTHRLRILFPRHHTIQFGLISEQQPLASTMNEHIFSWNSEQTHTRHFICQNRSCFLSPFIRVRGSDNDMRKVRALSPISFTQWEPCCFRPSVRPSFPYLCKLTHTASRRKCIHHQCATC